MYPCIFNHFYVIGPQSYLVWRNNTNYTALHRSKSFKVTDFGTNRKPICDFLVVINSNLPPILHHFQVMADYWSNFRYRQRGASQCPHWGDPCRISGYTLPLKKLEEVSYQMLTRCSAIAERPRCRVRYSFRQK